MENKDFVIEDGVLVQYKGKDKNVVVPEGVTEIGGTRYEYVDKLRFYGGFYKLKTIESITLPTSLKTLDATTFYYLSNLKSIECKGEVEIEFNYAFPGCKKMVYLICNPNTPLSKLPDKWKQMLAIGVTKYIDDGNTVSEEAKAEVKKYIVSQNKKQQLYKIGYEYPFLLKFMIKEGILSEKLYDEMIEYARKNEIVDLAVMLIEGKSVQYHAAGAFERAEKQLDKDIAHEQKMADKTSTTYLKTQWSWKKQEDGSLIIWTYKGTESEVFIPYNVGKNIATTVRGSLFRSPAFERDQWLRYNIKKIHFADGILRIGETLAHFDFPTDVYLPASVEEIHPNAFFKNRDITYICENVTIHAPAGSYAEQFAKENNIPFVVE